MNDALKSERLEFFERIESDKYRKLTAEFRAAQIIQALFRGYRKRPYKVGKGVYEMRQYRPLHPSRKDLQLELSTFAYSIGIKLI